jgi:hypothetical protein
VRTPTSFPSSGDGSPHDQERGREETPRERLEHAR